VEPVWVATISPSAWHLRIGFASLDICVWRILEGSPADRTTSFSASGRASSPVRTASFAHFSIL